MQPVDVPHDSWQSGLPLQFTVHPLEQLVILQLVALLQVSEQLPPSQSIEQLPPLQVSMQLPEPGQTVVQLMESVQCCWQSPPEQFIRQVPPSQF